MINLARGSVALTAAVLLVAVSFYFQRTVEAVSIVAIDSQNEIQNEINKIQNNQLEDIQSDKSSDTTEVKETITVTIDNLDDKNVTGTKTSSAKSFSATAYCLKGRTAMGHGVRRGIVAADPRVLPLGTRISLNAGSYSGSYLVSDTGGAVKGRKLDIWVPSCSEAIKFGRRSVSVNVVGKK
jgi:3D (Asp-Asp-Asp) domain-containing protein